MLSHSRASGWKTSQDQTVSLTSCSQPAVLGARQRGEGRVGPGVHGAEPGSGDHVVLAGDVRASTRAR